MAVQTYLPGPTPDTVRTPSGQTLPVPVGWGLLPPGNAAPMLGKRLIMSTAVGVTFSARFFL